MLGGAARLPIRIAAEPPFWRIQLILSVYIVHWTMAEILRVTSVVAGLITLAIEITKID